MLLDDIQVRGSKLAQIRKDIHWTSDALLICDINDQMENLSEVQLQVQDQFTFRTPDKKSLQ